jgi:glutamate--cysteine ligase
MQRKFEMTHYLQLKILALIAILTVLVLVGKVLEHARLRHDGGVANDRTDNNEVVKAAAQQMGIQVKELPGGFLELQKDNQVTYSSGSDFTFEKVIPWKICGDKLLTATLLREHGLPVPNFAGVSPLAYSEALRFFREFPKPVVVKPQRSTSGGAGVTTGISSEKDFQRAFAIAGSYGKDVMIEEFVPGENYRVLVLSGRILSIVKRNRLHVIGDGKSTVTQLVDHSLAYNIARLRPTMQRILDNDTRQYLKNNDVSLNDVPGPNERYYLKMICNNGPIEDVTDDAPDACKSLALKAAKIIGAKFCAVDLISKDYSDPTSKGQFTINEVNTSPALFLTGAPLELGKTDLRCTEEVLREIFHPK